MDNLSAKKGEKVVFNGRYDLLPKDIDRSVFRKGKFFTLSEDSDPGNSYSCIDLVEVPYGGGFNTVAFDNFVTPPTG